MRIWLKKIRKSQKLTQLEVSTACGISRTMITEIENGKAMPSPKTAKKIATVLKFDWTKFYDGDKAAAKKSDKKLYKADTHR